MAISYWIGFNVFVIIMLALDLGVFHRTPHEIKFKEAMIWSLFWISLSMCFNAGIYFFMGHQEAVDFFTGYIIEKSLSVDNIFVFLLIFSYFRVPSKHQHKILYWGVIGAMLMRAGFIWAGIEMIERFHWIVYIFGAFLVYTGIKIAINNETKVEIEKNPVVLFAKKFLRFTTNYDGNNFFTRIKGVLYATPMLLVLIVIETSDVIFAVDSIPAILSVTRDAFIVYTSNVFAIMGLRSLYFALAGVVHLFRFLHYGLAFVLTFVGLKMLASNFIVIPNEISLLIIISILTLCVFFSLVIKPKETK